MNSSPARWRRALAVALAAAALAASAAPPASRDEALAGLAHADAATRAEAVVWVANHGAMADAELLHARLRDDSPFVRGFAEQGLWLLWSRSGDAEIDRLMARGSEAMQAGRLAEAIAIFTGVIRKRPAFAEGWNKRATARHLAGAYRQSIADCEEVFKRNPKHFGALSGNGLNWLRLEQPGRALEYLRRALEVNPNMLGVEMQIREIEEAQKAARGRAA